VTYRLLVIDNDPQCVESIIEHARTRGHSCSAVTDSTRALAVARELRPDAIVCALQMPTLDGRDILSRVRADPVLTSTPVIIVTRVTDDYARDVCMRYGASAVLLKPIGAAELFSCIDEALGLVNAFTVAWQHAQHNRTRN